LFIPTSPALHAETGATVDFRVSGIMRVGEELYRGLVESPDGKKKIVRQGDIIDYWKVVSINEHCIILSKETKNHEECLSGTGETENQTASKEMPHPTAPADKAVNPSGANVSHVKPVDKVGLLQALDGLALKGRGLTMEAISEAVLPLTDLPAGSRITEINGKVPNSAQNALSQIRQQVDNSGLVKLTTQNGADNQNSTYLQTAHPTGMK